MNTLYIFFLIFISVPSLFSAASQVTEEWANDQMMLDQLKSVRRDFKSIYNRYIRELPTFEQRREAYIIRMRLDDLLGQVWNVYNERPSKDLLEKYPYQKQLWIDMYTEIRASSRSIPTLAQQRSQERAMQE